MMNISSVQSTAGIAKNAAGIANDKGAHSRPAQTNEETAASNINSLDELREAETKGSKLSIGEEQYIRSIERALEAAKGPVTSLEMSVHEQTKEIVIKVKNKETGELIREVPPEKILDMVAKFMELNGIIIDERG